MEMESDRYDYECCGSKKLKNEGKENRNEDSSHSNAHKVLKKLDEDEINEIYKSFPSSPVREKKIETSPRLSNAPSETTQKHVTFDMESKHPRKKIDRQRLAKLYNNLSESELKDSIIDCTSPSGQSKSPNLSEQGTDQLRKMLSLRTQHMKAYREIARSKNENSEELVGKGRGKLIANLKKQHEINPVTTEDFHSNDDSSSEQSNESVQFHDAIDHPIEFVGDIPKPCTDSQLQHVANERNSAELENECDPKKERNDTESPQFHDSNQNFVNEPDSAEIDQIQNVVENAVNKRHLTKTAQIPDSNERHLPESVEIQHSNINIASERNSIESSQIENICRDSVNEGHLSKSDPISDLNKRYSLKSIVIPISVQNSTRRISPEPASTREWYKRDALESVEIHPSNKNLGSEGHSSEISQVRDSNIRHSSESTQIQHCNEDTANERLSFALAQIQDLNARHSTETVEIQHCIENVTNERYSSDSTNVQDFNEGTASEQHVPESAEAEDSNKRHSPDSTNVKHLSEEIMSERHLPESAQVLDSDERHSPEYVGVQHSTKDTSGERHSIETIEIQHSNENPSNERHSSDSIHIQDSTEAFVNERHTPESAQVRDSNERHSTEMADIQHSNEDATSKRDSSNSTHIQHSTEGIVGERHSLEVAQVRNSNEQQSTETVAVQQSNDNNTNEPHSPEIAQIQDSNERHSPIYVEIQHSNESTTSERHSTESIQLRDSNRDIANGKETVELEDSVFVHEQLASVSTPDEQSRSKPNEDSANGNHPMKFVPLQDSNHDSTRPVQLVDSLDSISESNQEAKPDVPNLVAHRSQSPIHDDNSKIPLPSPPSPPVDQNPTNNVHSADTPDNIDLICVPLNVNSIPSPPPNQDATSSEQNPSSAPAIDAQTSQNNDPQGIPPQPPNQDANIRGNPPTNTHHQDSSNNPNNHLPPHHQDANEFDRTAPRNPIKFGWKTQNHVHWDDGNSSSNRSPYFNPNNSYRGRSRGWKFNQVKSGSYGRNDFKHSENQYRDRKHDTSGQSSFPRARRSDFHSKDRSSNNYKDNRCDDSGPSCQHKGMDIDIKNKPEPEYRDDDSKRNYSIDREKEFPTKHKYDLFEKTYTVRREDKFYDTFYHNIESSQLNSLPNFSDVVDNPDHQERDNNPLPKDGKFKPYIPPEAYDNNYYPVERNERSDSSKKNDTEEGAETIDDAGQKHCVSDKDNRPDYRPHYSNRRSRQDDHKFRSSDPRARSTDMKNHYRGEYGHRHESRNEHSEFASQKYARNHSRRRDRKDSEQETRSDTSRGHQGDGERRSYSKHRRYDSQTDVEAQSSKKADVYAKPKYDSSHSQTNTYRTKAVECACDTDSLSEVESSSQHCPKCDCKLQNVRTESTPWTEKKPNPRPGRKQRERRRRLEAARNHPPNYHSHSSEGKPMLTVESLENQLRPPPGKVMKTVQAVENQPYRPPETVKTAPSSENECRRLHFHDKSHSRTPHSDRFHSGHDKTGCPYSKPFTPDGREKSFKSANVNKERPTKYIPEKPKKIKKKDKKPYVSKPEYEPLITEIYGDLFTASEEYSLAHCVGQDFIMGAGIAVVFRKLFGRQEELLRQKKRVGEVAILPNGKRFIFYLITKPYSNSKPTMDTMKAAVHSLKEWCINLGVNKLAIPRIGSGLDRLDWDNVKDVLYEEFRDTDIQIVVYVLPD